MSYYRRNFVVVLTIFIVCSTRAEKSSDCDRGCGKYSVPYPFGFSEKCEIKLNCSDNRMEIEGFQVEKVTPTSIFVNLTAKCNRSMESIKPLFSKNFAPTRNNSLLVQNCSSQQGSCFIPSSGLIGSLLKSENCHGGNISCFLQTKSNTDVMRPAEVKQNTCKFLFSAISIEQGKDTTISLHLQMLELGWWLEGPPGCSENATPTTVRYDGVRTGYRCQCNEGYIGDGFNNGTRCRKE